MILTKEQEDELNEFIFGSYKSDVCNVMTNALKFMLPNIKNLKIEDKGHDCLPITFDEGIYTKEEVHEKINEIKNYKP